jgi:hypothetical protein
MSTAYTPQIVLLAGWAGTGKDLFGAYLTQNHGFRRYAFADPVKEMVALTHGIDRASLNTAEGKAATHPYTGKIVRDILIEVAEDARAHDLFCWANVISTQILKERPERVVITDWRLLPEFFALQRAIPAATFYHFVCKKPLQNYSDVPDATEYGLLGFPFRMELYPTYWIDMKFLKFREQYFREGHDVSCVLGIKVEYV